MSSQRGNVKKSGQRHQNKRSFKNDLHDSSGKTKMIKSLHISQCCAHCTEIIEWKIKYKKYKPLTVAKKCTKCLQKTVKRAYSIICEPCAANNKLCMKCGSPKDIIRDPQLSEAEEAKKMAQLEQELKLLPEKKRRTFMRLQASGKLGELLENENSQTTNEGASALDTELSDLALQDEIDSSEDSDNDLLEESLES